MHHYIVTVTADDQVGIVYSVTGTLHELGGNLLELSQTVMRGYFTIILEVAFEQQRDPAELAALIKSRGEKFQLNVAVLAVGQQRPPRPVEDGDRFILTVLGDDHPGNVHRIAGALARRGVNIVDLHARTEGPRFSLVMEAFLPPDLSPADLRTELMEFGRELGLEAFVQHENIFVATSEPSPVRLGDTRQPEGRPAVVPH